MAFSGLLLSIAVVFGAQKLGLPFAASLAIFAVASLVALFIAMRGWPALGRVLVAYGLAARIPVIIVMLVAMLGNWGTHYDAAPPDPNFPEMGVLAEVVPDRGRPPAHRLDVVHRRLRDDLRRAGRHRASAQGNRHHLSRAASRKERP